MKFLIIAVLALNLYSQDFYYYQDGNKVDLYSASQTRSVNNNLVYFQDNNGFSLGVGRTILVGLYKAEDKQSVVEYFGLKNVRSVTPTLLAVETSDYQETLSLSVTIYESKLVKFSHPDFVKRYKKRYLSTDPLIASAHHLNAISTVQDAHIHLGGAWSVTRGAGIKLGIYDDAVEVSHEDLRGALLAEYDAGNKDFNSEPDTYSESHGTVVAGLAAARMNNIGTVGVAPESSILVVKFAGYDQSDLATIEGFNWFKSKDVDVINNSWGTYNVSDAVKSSIEDLATNGRNGKGIVLVFAQGNDYCNDTEVCNGFYLKNDESSLDSVIGVGATNRFNQRSDYSNYGIYLDLMAPGGDGGEIGSLVSPQTMASIDRSGDAGYSSSNYVFNNSDVIGTSFAAPLVSATAALVLAANPELTRVQVQSILQNTADKVGGYNYVNGRSYEMGYGKINATRAVSEALRLKNVSATLSIKNGWNLLSLPVVATLSYNTLLSASEGQYHFDVLGSFHSIYVYGEYGYEVNPDVLKEGQGFWIYSNEIEKNLVFTGKSYMPDPQTLRNGWNLLGTSATLTDPKTFYEAQSVWSYKNGSWSQNPSAIYAGEGFWIYK